MKKIFITLLLVTMAVGGAFAQDFRLSAGVGGLFGLSFTNTEMSSADMELRADSTNIGGGAYAYFDATYVELTVGLLSRKGFSKSYTKYGGVKTETEIKLEDSPTITTVELGLFGKYPIAINDKVSFFPLLGIDYQMMVSYKDKDGNDLLKVLKLIGIDKNDMNSLWLKAGVGLDFSFTDAIYLRLETLYGIKFDSKYEKDARDSVKDEGAKFDYLTHGLTARLAIGFKF
jgi:opacity protein-like surface antigen